MNEFLKYISLLVLAVYSASTSAGDLDRNLQASAPMRIVGDTEQYEAEVGSDKRLSTNSRMLGTYQDTLVPLKVDEDGNLQITTALVSQIPNLREFHRKVLAPGQTDSGVHAIAEDTAIKEIHLGGILQCEGVIGKYDSTYSDLLGTFNSSGEVSAWTNTSIGDSAPIAWTYSTAQSTEGTGSASHTFVKSDGNNYPEITYTFSPARDFSDILRISGDVRATVAAGGAQTRTVQIRVTSGTAVRIFQISGTTTTAPFSTEQWLTIDGALSTPDATAGVGTFDINNVNSISLRLQDGGNKAGTVYWDNVKVYQRIELLEKIYSANGSTTQIVFDPVLIFDSGESLYMSMKNNSSNTGEVQLSVSGVKL